MLLEVPRVSKTLWKDSSVIHNLKKKQILFTALLLSLPSDAIGIMLVSANWPANTRFRQGLLGLDFGKWAGARR